VYSPKIAIDRFIAFTHSALEKPCGIVSATGSSTALRETQQKARWNGGYTSTEASFSRQAGHAFITMSIEQV
jgi:hypothetical protein